MRKRIGRDAARHTRVPIHRHGIPARLRANDHIRFAVPVQIANRQAITVRKARKIYMGRKRDVPHRTRISQHRHSLASVAGIDRNQIWLAVPVHVSYRHGMRIGSRGKGHLRRKGIVGNASNRADVPQNRHRVVAIIGHDNLRLAIPVQILNSNTNWVRSHGKVHMRSKRVGGDAARRT